MNDPSMINNEFNLNLLSINEIERIEICKGAQSTLYGSDALGGVINLITTKNDLNKLIHLNANMTAGNYGVFKSNVKDSPLHLTARVPQILIRMPYLEIILAHPWHINPIKH
jgi:outer membrane receptor protein involved in Fe transport